MKPNQYNEPKPNIRQHAKTLCRCNVHNFNRCDTAESITENGFIQGMPYRKYKYLDMAWTTCDFSRAYLNAPEEYCKGKS